jgi:hypothetical protein
VTGAGAWGLPWQEKPSRNSEQIKKAVLFTTLLYINYSPFDHPERIDFPVS